MSLSSKLEVPAVAAVAAGLAGPMLLRLNCNELLVVAGTELLRALGPPPAAVEEEEEEGEGVGVIPPHSV